MIIIIEGIDGSGKSTLAKQISAQSGYPIIHRVQPKTDDDKATMMASYEKLTKSSKNVILDRSWYSELAYAPVMRDKTIISYRQMYQLEMDMAKRGAIIVYCTGKIDELWKRAHSRGEEYITSREDFNEIYENYEGIFAMPHIVPVMKYKCPLMHPII